MKTVIFIGGLPNLLVRLWHHLSRRRKRQFLLFVVLMLVSGVAEIVSLGAVLPFLGIITAPERAFHHPIIAYVAQMLRISAPSQMALPLTVVFAVAALFAGAIRICLLWSSTKLAVISGADLSIEVYRRTLYQPYPVHLARNSSEVISGMVNKVTNAVFGVLLPLLTLLGSIVLLAAIMITLISIDPMVALIAIVGFGVSYGLISWMARRRLRRNSHCIACEQTQVIKALQEGLAGIRDVLLDGTQPVYCDLYRKADHPLRRAEGNNVFIAQSPRFVMEALGMILIAALAYGLSRQVGGLATALPVLGALALGAQRLLPVLQQNYSSWASIAGHHAALADIIGLLDQPLPAEMLRPAPAPFVFQNVICFDAVRFRYTNDGPWVVDGFTLTIPKGHRVGFIGSTGSGKSTTLDLLMGLLIPTEGALLVDGTPIRGHSVRSWQRTIAHVPQCIYLADTTVTENIALGVPRAAIDLEKVREAARQAQIADFIESRSEGYNALVGERGIRLSGGQRQRIGIARALYKRATVLIFDEATSALDGATESAVMEAIENLHRSLTIVMIAHRFTTLQHCDLIVKLEHGKIVEQGSYAHFMNHLSQGQTVSRIG